MQNPPSAGIRQLQARQLTLAQYIHRRNGLPAGAGGSLRNMLHRSLGAGSFAGFWQHWNPVFGYGLGRYVFSPLRQLVSPAFALVLTFIVSGAIHDLVTMAVRGDLAFLFTPWFFFLGLGVIGGRAMHMDLSGRPWLVRAVVNITYVAVCLAAVLAIKAVYRSWA